MSGSYRDLRVWQNAVEAVELVVCVYHENSSFSEGELYGLTSQARRASVSIPSNIAEGKGRSTDRDRALFFCHAHGSLFELETQILIAQRLTYLNAARAEALIKISTELGRMLNSLIQSIRAPDSPKHSIGQNPASSPMARTEV